jgi:hypothetical protein
MLTLLQGFEAIGSLPPSVRSHERMSRGVATKCQAGLQEAKRLRG